MLVPFLWTHPAYSVRLAPARELLHEHASTVPAGTALLCTGAAQSRTENDHSPRKMLVLRLAERDDMPLVGCLPCASVRNCAAPEVYRCTGKGSDTPPATWRTLYGSGLVSLPSSQFLPAHAFAQRRQ